MDDLTRKWAEQAQHDLDTADAMSKAWRLGISTTGRVSPPKSRKRLATTSSSTSFPPRHFAVITRPALPLGSSTTAFDSPADGVTSAHRAGRRYLTVFVPSRNVPHTFILPPDYCGQGIDCPGAAVLSSFTRAKKKRMLRMHKKNDLGKARTTQAVGSQKVRRDRDFLCRLYNRCYPGRELYGYQTTPHTRCSC